MSRLDLTRPNYARLFHVKVRHSLAVTCFEMSGLTTYTVHLDPFPPFRVFPGPPPPPPAAPCIRALDGRFTTGGGGGRSLII